MSGGQTSVARERAEREKSVASLMTRDKERLAEEVIELKRVNDDVATRLKLAQAELIRATGELRKRERALEAYLQSLQSLQGEAVAALHEFLGAPSNLAARPAEGEASVPICHTTAINEQASGRMVNQIDLE